MVKKIIALILTLIVLIPKVHALDYFWSDKELDNYELIETEKRFKFYKEEREGKYIKKGEENLTYRYEDENDIKYEKIGDYQDSCTESNNTYIEYKTVYPYKLIPKGKYFLLSNIARDLEIKNIEIYYLDEKLSYDIIKCTSCNDEVIKAGGSMLLSLDDEIIVGNIKLKIESSSEVNTSYYGYFYDNDMNLIKKIHLFTNQNTYLTNDYDYVHDNFKEIYYQNEEVLKDHTKYPLEEKKMCQINSILTFRYNIVKKYYDDNYYSNLEDELYIKDSDNYKVFYKYLAKENNIENSIISSQDNSSSTLKDISVLEEYPVNTGYKGIENSINYNVIYLLILAIFVVIILFVVKKMST